jgi:hypothetical protein
MKSPPERFTAESAEAAERINLENKPEKKTFERL